MKPSTTFLLIALLASINGVLSDFWSERNSILANEASLLVGSSIQLTEDEQKVNDILMELKRKEFDEGFVDPSKFLPSIHFFHSKAAIEQSEVFKFIQKIPKGGSLHSHSSAMLSADALLNLTYMEGLYGCSNNDEFQVQFFFGNVSSDCEWRPLSDWRNEDAQFDTFLRSKMTLVVEDPVGTYGDINAIWSTFENIFDFTSPLFSYKQFLQEYLGQVLQEFHDDNVRYLEMRGSIGEVFDSDGTTYDIYQTAQIYLDTLRKFQETHHDFLGFRLIYARSRNVGNNTMESHIDQYLRIQERYPYLIAGFDLVGQEDLGQPLSSFADQLVAISNQSKFFFHAGETNWYGTTDLNLVDAILLNTSRIGHGFALSKHPEVLKVIKDRGIAVELNPLSNQVLKLVDDLRNHIGVSLIAGGYPVVITCDDPSFWGAKGLSHDWYMAFMAMTPRDGDLRILKQLALNSFVYSSLSEQDLVYALALLETWWGDFIQEILVSATYQ